MKKRVAQLKQIEAESRRRFRLGIVEPISGPLIIGDNRYAIWLLGGDDAVSISQENNKVCDILVRVLKIHGQHCWSEGDILQKLGIV